MAAPARADVDGEDSNNQRAKERRKRKQPASTAPKESAKAFKKSRAANMRKKFGRQKNATRKNALNREEKLMQIKSTERSTTKEHCVEHVGKLACDDEDSIDWENLGDDELEAMMNDVIERQDEREEKEEQARRSAATAHATSDDEDDDEEALLAEIQKARSLSRRVTSAST